MINESKHSGCRALEHRLVHKILSGKESKEIVIVVVYVNHCNLLKQPGVSFAKEGLPRSDWRRLLTSLGIRSTVVEGDFVGVVRL